MTELFREIEVRAVPEFLMKPVKKPLVVVPERRVGFFCCRAGVRDEIMIKSLVFEIIKLLRPVHNAGTEKQIFGNANSGGVTEVVLSYQLRPDEHEPV